MSGSNGTPVKAPLDIITEIPEQIDFPCPCKLKGRDSQGFEIELEHRCGQPMRAFPKTKAVQHGKPTCPAWDKNNKDRAWVSALLVAAGVAVQFAPDDQNYHGKPR
jgi:hypothetical protein